MQVSKKLTLSLLIGSLLLTGCGTGDMSDQEYVERARQYQEQHDTKAAIIELKNALKINPDNADARLMMGELYLQMGSGADAEKELSRAREQDVSVDTLVPRLMDAYLLQGKYDELLKLSTDNIQDDKILADVLAARGTAYLYKGELDKATQELESALQHNAKSVRALVGLARVNLEKKDYSQARKYVDQALDVKPDDASAWSVMGDIASAEDGLDKAVEAYSKSIEATGYTSIQNLKRALVYLQNKDYDNAKKDIDALKKRFPNSARINYTEGLLYFHQQKFPEAEAAFEAALKYDDDEIWARYYLGATNFAMGKHEQARDNLARFVTSVPNFVPALKLLAVERLRDKEYVEAEKLLRPVVKAAPADTVAMNLLASALMDQGKTDEGVKLLEKIAELQPDSGEARIRLGLGLMSKGDEAGAMENLEAAVDISPDVGRADTLLILGYIKQGEYEKAKQAAKKLVNKQPDKALGYIMQGKVYLAERNKDAAIKAFKKAVELEPGDLVAGSHLAQIARDDGDREQARKYYDDILSKHENNYTTLLNLAALEADDGNKEKSKQLLKKLVSTYPEALQPRLLLAREYLQEANPDEGLAVLADAMLKNGENPVMLGTMAELQLASREFSDAKDTIMNLVRLRPDMAQAQYFLAEAYRGLGDLENTEKALNKALDLDPDLVPAKLILVRLNLARKNLDEAQRLLNEVKKSTAADNPDVLNLEGMLLAGSGDLQQALQVYEKLFSINPQTATLRPLSRLYWALGQKEKSLSMLEDWVKAHPDDLNMRLEMANSLMGMGRDADAMQEYEQILKTSPDNLLALNNLAWHFRKSDPEKALVYAEKAAEAAPTSPSVLDTLAVVLMERGELERAERQIERALQPKPKVPSIYYHHAQILEKQGKNSEALAVLKPLLATYSQFPERAEAEQMLKRLSGS